MDVNYAGNAGITAWAIAQFNGMAVNAQAAAMLAAGIITGATSSAIVLAGVLSGPQTTLAHNWLTTYVNNTFPTDIDCDARFVAPAPRAPDLWRRPPECQHHQ